MSRHRGCRRGPGCLFWFLMLVIVGAIWWVLYHLWPLLLALTVCFIGWKACERRIFRRTQRYLATHKKVGKR